LPQNAEQFIDSSISLKLVKKSLLIALKSFSFIIVFIKCKIQTIFVF